MAFSFFWLEYACNFGGENMSFEEYLIVGLAGWALWFCVFLWVGAFEPWIERWLDSE